MILKAEHVKNDSIVLYKAENSTRFGIVKNDDWKNAVFFKTEKTANEFYNKLLKGE